MQHRMSEITIVPHGKSDSQESHHLQREEEENNNNSRRYPACVSSIQAHSSTGTGGYKVKRVLYHHANFMPRKNRDRGEGVYYNYYESRSHHERIKVCRATCVAFLGLAAVFLILWLVSAGKAGVAQEEGEGG
jgi:hypothetical protein